MNIVSFLSELREKNITIKLNGDDLKVTGLKKDTSSDIIDRLKRNKPELLSFLRRSGESAAEISAAPKMDDYPISNAQRQLWLLDQTTNAGAAYNLFFTQEWNNTLDLEVLELCMQFLLRRHETLRTVFTEVNGEPRQKILSVEECGFSIRKAKCNGDKERFLQNQLRSEAEHIFDLKSGPLVRLLVLSFGEKEHLLIFTLHHIISDGWSVQVFVQELSACYIAIKNNEAPGLQPLRIQYKDFAWWQQLATTQQENKKHKAYWLSVLGPERSVLDLPADHRRPAVKTYSGSQVRVRLPLTVLQQINELCQRCHCRIFGVLTAALKTLIYHYTKETDVLAGMPVSGRAHTELQAQVGYYVNMVVLRSNVQPHFSFDELVMQTEQNMLQAFEHQEYGFDQLVEDLGVKHDASRSPVFDLMVNYDKRNTLLFDQVISDQAPMAVSKFDLEADFIEYSDGLMIGLTYNNMLFNRERMERMGRHLQCLLLNALDDSSKAISSLEYLYEEEKQLIETFNYTDAWYPYDKTVMHLLEDQVKRTPNALALEFENRAVSYTGFNELVNRAAHYLRDVHGVQPGDHIGLMMDRSERMMLAIFAIMKAGAAYVPIDPAYPAQRKSYMIEDSEVKLVISSQKENLQCGLVVWDEINFDDYPEHDPVHVNTPEDPAYMIYTSGSTGNPKGVVIQHYSLTNFCEWAANLIYKPAGRALRTMLNGTISFDAAVEIIFPPLLNGSSVQVVPQQVKDNPDELLSRIQESGIEVLDLIPSHLHLLMQVAKSHDIKLPLVQYVTTGGELLQQETCELFFGVMPGAVIVNGYGPTEATVNTTCCLLDAGTGAKPNCIGEPLPNMRVHILDAWLRETGIGIWGELFIAGTGLAKEYWKRQELTEEKFMVHPRFGRIYRSGDVARWNEKGEVEFAGRADNQVKIRGFRIELGEIESAIQSFASVQEAVVVVNENKILAVIVWANNHEAVPDLRRHLLEVLPKYMLPDQFITVERIPRTGSGKLDRRALEQGETKLPIAAAYTGVQNKTEEKLLLIWEELLDMRGIDVTDDFFEIGGHSIKAMRMVSRICREFTIKITVREVFLHSTIQKLSRYIEQQQKANIEGAIIPVEPGAYYALSAGQRSIWLAVQTQAAQTAYNMVSAYEWNEALDEKKYRHAWMQLLQRHEILRTVFVMHEGKVWQKVLDKIDESLLFVNVSSKKDIEDLLTAAQQCRYDLANGPLVNLTVAKFSDTRYEIILGIHHIISDAWSLQLMQQELLNNYNGITVDAPRIQYKDYAAWQNTRLSDRDYWMHQLAGELVVPQLPADRLRTANRSFEGQVILHRLNGGLLTSLQELARQQQCSLYTVLVAAVHLLLFKYTGNHDILTGIPCAGREQEELEKQLGYYVNTLVIRNKIDAEESTGSFVSNIKKTLLDAYSHQSYPFDKLTEELGPLFDVMVNYEHRDGILDEVIAGEQDAASRFDLSVHFTRYSNGITLALTYNTGLFNKDRMQRLAFHLENILQEITKEQKIASLPLMQKNELEQILSFNQTQKDYGAPGCFHHLFEQQVIKTPQALAVKFGENNLSYEQLNQRANRLANYLRELNAGDRIGIMMPRSEKMIIALLAILKSGAAYVPIDPAYPQERRMHMMQDSGIKLLISEQWNEADWQHCSAENPGHCATPDHLAYIIYTSGSTGKPKGVMIRHRSLFNLCQWLKELIYKDEPLLATVTASLSFDASVKQLFPPLISGSALHIISEEERMSPVKYAAALQSNKTNVADLTPSFLQLLLQTLQGSTHLKYVLAGGEILQNETARLFHEILPQAKLINVYGPTEACVDASFKIIDDEITIGSPLPNVSIFITDEFLQPVPIGVFGELLIGGAGLAEGYCNQPDLTAQKFIQHPQFGRLYRTGDIARWNINGEIEFSGRVDGQVKLRGYRVEIAEIENAIASFDAVKQAAVIFSNNALSAFVVWKESKPSELNLHLQQILPAYMVPTAIHSLDELPKAPGGKIDRKALQSIQVNTNYTPAETECQRILISIWEELLQQSPIGIDDDFWQRGGHSLKAMRMMVMIFSQLRSDVSIKDIFEARTIRSISALIESRTTTEYEPIPKVPDGLLYYPLSHAQKRLWVIHQLEEALTAYNIVHSYNVPLGIEERSFHKAVRYLIKRHEILRTVFVEHNGEAMQHIVAANDFTIDVCYLDMTGNEDKQKFIDEVVHWENERVFNLQDGPLFNITVFRIGPNESTCVLNMHHIISDAWSINIFKRELEEAYQSFVQQQLPEHKPLACQYKDYAAWMDHSKLGASKQYWNELLQGELHVLDMPADLPRPAKKTYKGKHSSLLIQSAGIKQNSHQYGCSTFTFLYACLNALLSRYTHQQDLITGLAAAGRHRPELQDQLGFYVNVLPFRLQLEQDMDFDGLLRKVSNLLMEQLQHQSYPFDQMVEDLEIKKDLSRSPLFDVLVNHQQYAFAAGALHPDGESSFSKYDLTIDFVEFSDAVLVSINYNTDLFWDETISRMLRCFEMIVNDALANPKKKLHELDFIPEADQLLMQSFNTNFATPWNKTVIDLLEAQSEGIALELDEVSFTYAELNSKVNQYAHYLRAVHGIKPGDHVGVMIERSEQMILAVYAIIKAGGAYVPIDPAYPAERRAFMIEDSGIKLLLTKEDLDIDVTAYSANNPGRLNTPNDPVYMIYTSGSTGTPKAVLVRHASLTNLCQWYAGFIPPSLRIYLNASINFDVSVGQIFGCLATGGTLLISQEQVKTDPNKLIDFLNRQKADVIDITPSFLQVLLMNDSKLNVKLILAAGEVLPASTCNLVKDARLFNLYGPTEACVYATAEEVKLPVQQYNTIGKPLLNTKLHVLDAQLNETGIGVWGEIFIGGAGVAEYWQRDELNKQKFIGHKNLGRLYRTGDLGRWNNAGVMEFRGRNDGQVKVRGFRIELGEIEQAIRSFSGITDAVVMYNSTLVAFVAWLQPKQEELRKYLLGKLPAYMVPDVIVVLPSLPVTGSGKIDRASLQAIQTIHHAQYKAASTHTEQKLLNIWKETLPQTGGVDEDFFELGGHSLKAMRMVSAIYKQLGAKLNIREIFTHRTVQQLAKYIDAQTGSTYKSIERIAESDYYVVSPGQKDIWLACQQQGGDDAYQMTMQLPLPQSFNVNAFNTAWEQLLQRHEILRTAFVVKDGELYQQVLPNASPLIKNTIEQDQITITLHHIIGDAWSLKIIARDLQELYTACIENRQAQLPVLPIQYKDFAAWQSQKKYRDVQIHLPELPADYPRPLVKNYEGNTLSYKLQAAEINKLCRELQCSQFTLLTACVNFLLYRCTSENITIGIPVAGREMAEVQDSVGYYVNMQPISTAINGNESFEEFIANVNEQLLDAYQSNPVQNPLFNVVLNYDDSEAAAEPGETPSVSKFDLSFHFSQHSVSLTYSTALFSKERMERMAEHLLYIISNAGAFLHERINEIKYFEFEHSDTFLQYDITETIPSIISKQPPQSIAVYNSLTYGELNEASNQLANLLRRQISTGDRIGLMMDRSERMVIALLAILKSGAAYVPLDPAYPHARCQYMQQDSGMKLLIAEKNYGSWCTIPIINWEDQSWLAQPSTCNFQPPTSKDLAYIIYTSGSTGQPKGVCVTHQSLHNLCAWHIDAFEVNENSRGTLYAGIGFDASAWELWPYLVAGASVCAVEEAARLDLHLLAEYFDQNKITNSFLPTPACEELIRNNISLPNVKLLTGGDRLRLQPPAGMQLYNNYGPTECTVVATSTKIVPGNTIPIGKPIANTRIYILDKNLQPVPIGIYGEMYIGGDGLAQGYHNKPELTAEKFIHLNNERLFKTGDFARWLPNGNIDFLGRIDNQIKIRGYRVEIAEVENAFSKLEGLNSVRIIADRSGSETKLVAFYEGNINTGTLQSLLPAYMIPSQIIQVEKFPLTANGKIDDKELLNSIKHNQDTTTFTGNEAIIANLWQEIIGAMPSSNSQSFFDLGGHSIKAMQLVNAIEKQTNTRISLRDVYNNPSLSAMAALLDKLPSTGLSINLNNSSADKTMYLIPPIGGSATIYSSLAKQLSFKCIGLQYPGFENEEFAASIEATAQQFCKEMTGDNVYLLGYSLGALAAFETAKLLEASGKKITLILLDRNPSTHPIPEDALQSIANIEMAKWQQHSPKMKNLVLQNLRNLNNYAISGSVKGNIIAFNATQSMQDWKHFTTGNFIHHQVNADHYNILSHPDLLKINL